jgi:hypothetical protein
MPIDCSAELGDRAVVIAGDSRNPLVEKLVLIHSAERITSNTSPPRLAWSRRRRGGRLGARSGADHKTVNRGFLIWRNK